MKKILLKYLNLYVLSGLLLVGFAGCSDDKDNDPVNPGPDVEELPSIGTYSFRGEANRIVSGEATMDGGYFTCIFSFLRKRYRTGKLVLIFCFLWVCIGRGKWWMHRPCTKTTSISLFTKIRSIIIPNIKG